MPPARAAKASAAGRLRSIAAAVATAGVGAAPPAAPLDIEPAQLLTEEQMRQWIAAGYISLPVETLPKAFHDQVGRQPV